MRKKRASWILFKGGKGGLVVEKGTGKGRKRERGGGRVHVQAGRKNRASRAGEAEGRTTQGRARYQGKKTPRKIRKMETGEASRGTLKRKG